VQATGLPNEGVIMSNHKTRRCRYAAQHVDERICRRTPKTRPFPISARLRLPSRSAWTCCQAVCARSWKG